MVQLQSGIVKRTLSSVRASQGWFTKDELMKRYNDNEGIQKRNRCTLTEDVFQKIFEICDV